MNATRTNNGKTSRLSTIRERLTQVAKGKAEFSRQYISHLRSMVAPSTLRKWGV